MFFQRTDPVHQAARRLVRRLERAGIAYAIAGAMAVNAHGARRTTDDVDVLLSRKGLEQFKESMVGKWYATVPGRPRRFIERQSGVKVDVLVTGGRPGFGQPVPFSFPDPARASETIEKTQVLALANLIQLKLAARRYYDFGDVAKLVKVHNLDESYLGNLHPFVHHDFIECLEEKRREDAYEARED